jgi:hypothetical protein
MTTILHRGDIVRIRLFGSGHEWCEGRVAVASCNGEAVGLLLDGAVAASGGMYVGAIALYVDYLAGTVTDLAGEQFELEYAK